MKKLLVVIPLFLLFFGKANAQITKGNWMFGGNASFSNKENYQNKFESSSKVKHTEFDIKANAGYFFIDNLQAGVRLGYSDYKVSTYAGTDRHRLKYGIYSRYYFLKSEKIVNIYLDGEYFLGNSVIESGDIKDKLNGFSISAGPTVFFNSSVAMEMGISYSSTKIKGANDSTENNLQFSIGFQIFLEKQ